VGVVGRGGGSVGEGGWWVVGEGCKCIGNFFLLQLAGQVTALPPPLPPTFTAHLHRNKKI